MKPLLRFSVPLWTLLVFSAFLKSTRAQNISNCATGTLNITTTTTTTNVTFQLDPNCSLTVENNTSENGLITGLTPGAVYQIVLNCSGSCNVSQITTKPETVSLTVTNITTSSMFVSWTKPVGMSSFYKVQWTGGGRNFSVNVSATFYNITNLTAGVQYEIIVTAVAGDNYTEGQSATVTEYTKPEKVKTLTVSEIRTSSIFLNWTDPQGERSLYRVEWTNGTIKNNKTVTETEVNVTELTPGVCYTFTVTAVAGDNRTESDVATLSKCTKPEVVTSLSAANITTSSIFVSWTKPVGNSSFYKVQWTGGGRNFSVNVYETLYNIANLTAGVQYEITVTAVAGDGYTEGQSATVTKYTKPLGVQDLMATPGETHLLVNWNNPPEYKESYKYLFSWNQTNSQMRNLTVTQTLYNITNLEPGQCYSIKVITETSDETQSAPVMINRCTNASPVTILGCQGPNDNTPQIILSCSKPSGQYTDFQIIVNGNNITTNSCNYTISGLNHNTNYDVTVKTLSYGNPSIPVYRVCSTGIAITTIAVTVSVAVFLILFSVLIGFIIYWKRLAKKESPDIQIQSLRAKVSVAVSVEDFEAYYKKQRADSNCGFAEEFEDLKVVGTAQSKLHALNVENKPKNRYNNVLPYDSSRVKLSILHGSPSDDYINANYMPGYNSRKEFIAAQGPLPTTVNDFWRMIWEKNVQTLVMLTRCNEQGRVKCEQYWSSGTMRCDNIIVTSTSEIPLEDWTIRDFDIKNVKTAETRAVRHFHFTAWPDHGVPETTELLISFRHLVREHMNQYSRHSPTVVHCSAGVGRTGTFIAIDRLIFQIERENTVDVFGIVHDLRMHRPLMVQTEDQYVFLNQCALDIIRSRTGTNVDLIYQNTAALSIYENIGPKKGSPKNGYHNA